jgi:molybdopterin synthase catalytic subunit
MMRVIVQFFGPAADVTGVTDREYELPDAATLAELLRQLHTDYPPFARAGAAIRYAVNCEYATLAHPLGDGDEVAVIPPVSGGSNVLVEIVDEPIELALLVRAVQTPQAGAVVTFEGVVRAEGAADNPLVALEYQAHGAMALRRMRDIRERAIEAYPVCAVALVHRVGRLEVGATSVAIAVSAPHRAAAFEACRFVIDALKADVPIWKREIYADGQSAWVDPTTGKE